MKKLSQIKINSSRIISDEELKIITGGWEGYCCIYCEGAAICGPASGTSQESAMDILSTTYSWCLGGPTIGCGDSGY